MGANVWLQIGEGPMKTINTTTLVRLAILLVRIVDLLERVMT